MLVGWGNEDEWKADAAAVAAVFVSAWMQEKWIEDVIFVKEKQLRVQPFNYDLLMVERPITN